MPYDINQGGTTFGKKLPYKNASLSTFSAYNITDYAAWSQGSSYTQATGYQAWDGASTKSNKEVESYLISPALNTTCESGKVRISFDHTLRYTNNVSGWKNYHKIYMSKDYDGIPNNFNEATWTQLDYTPAASTYSDWTLYSSGYINVPSEFVNCDSVYVAFYFYAPSSASTTWELENFLIEEGDASDTPDTPVTPDTPSDVTEVTCAQAKELCNALSDGGTSTETYSVTGYITDVYTTISQGQQSFWMADTKDGGKVLQAYWANLPQGVSAFTKGSKVKITGQLLKYVKDGNVTAEIKNATVEILESGDGGSSQPTTGTEVSCSEAAKLCNALADGASSEETYSVTGYITDVYSTISKNQQSFWMADSKDGGKVLQAYWANLPEGVSAFTSGSKVKITGKLLKYVKDGNVTPEIKNADVVILENGSGGDDTPDTPSGTSEGVSISGTTVTLTNSAATAGSNTVTLTVNDLGITDKASAVGTYSFSDGTTLTIAQGDGKSGPTYYKASNGFRIYASNTLSFAAASPIAKIEMECDSYNGTDYVGNATATVSFSGNNAVYCNKNDANSGGTQLRVKTIKITYAK